MKWLSLAAAAVCGLLVAAGLILAVKWPFVQRKVQASLAKSLRGEVRIDQFQPTYWPRPGFVAHGLSLRRTQDPEVPPLAVAERVEVKARWIDLIGFPHKLGLLEIDGLRLTIPPGGTRQRAEDFPPGDGKDYSGPSIPVDVIHLRDATLEVGTRGKPFVLPVPELRLNHVVKGKAAQFAFDALLPRPGALVHASGLFGPLHSTRLAQTQVTADFTLANARLADVGRLRGELNGHGHLQGTLAAIDVQAATETLAFAVGEGRAARVDASVDATVDGMNGDVVLHAIDASTGATKGVTRIHASGDILGKPKTARMSIAVREGRIEDVMGPFLSAVPPVAGELRTEVRVLLPPGRPGEAFLDRLQLDAAFSIPDERFTKQSTEASVSAFSRRADGADPASPMAKPAVASAEAPDVLLSVSGPIALRSGVARTTDLLVRMPGAAIHLAGTYDLHLQKVDLTGHVEMKSDLPHVTTGIKSKLLKPLAPFFKRHVSGTGEAPKMTVIPIKVSGTRRFKVSSNLTGVSEPGAGAKALAPGPMR